MDLILHGSARTTEAVRRAIQHSQEPSERWPSDTASMGRPSIAKWKKRTSDCDERRGPKEPRSTVLSLEEQAIVVAFRRYTLLPLDDCLYVLNPLQQVPGLND